MALSSDLGLTQTTRSQIPDGKRWRFAGETDSSPDIARPSVSLPTAVNSVPIAGAWCDSTASLGIYNTAGVFEVVISESILPGESSSTLGWIFPIYAFVNWICGVQIGPTFDAMGPRGLLITGTICTLIGIFALSFCTERYQIILSFSILTGIGSSLLVTPSMGCVAHGFMERRGLASGIAFVGDGFGGVLFPLMIQSLLPQVGWEWSIRILGVVLLLLCSMNVTFCRRRIPPRKGAATTWRDTLPDPQTEQEP
ncbi:hypothetical protein BGAL_0174g00070 [Botrytis galanthina]|uniref:Major facilitator superfamily (MFS) profile domain-containing protein n=1 Tax=Botrytis galanthina TaxID=278940 RepID=A0A4S8QY11_9HELO|nr:hypothetical protein BGAL_0174g00070 [Botrytis galanthina]